MYDKPKHQEFHIDGVKHINPLEAWEMLQKDEAVLLDIRETFETDYQRLDISDDKALYIPMTGLMGRMAEIPKDKPVFVACVVGERSTKVTYLLLSQGFENLVNLDGGLLTCAEHGLPFIVSDVPDSGCSGGCSCGHGHCC